MDKMEVVGVSRQNEVAEMNWPREVGVQLHHWHLLSYTGIATFHPTSLMDNVAKLVTTYDEGLGVVKIR